MLYPKRPKRQIRSHLYILPFILILVYIIFLLGRTIWTNREINFRVKALHQEISLLEEENQKLQALITYYQSDSFKEKEARLKLGYQKPQEKVLIVPKESADNSQESGASSITENQSQLKPNYQTWWQFIFN